MAKLSSGADVLDSLLGGGYDSGMISTIYGPAGSGKTTACMLACISAIMAGKKALFIDTEGGFSPERFLQLAEGDRQILRNVIILKPLNFAEQMKLLNSLDSLVSGNTGMVAIDTISQQYRVQISKARDVRSTNNELGVQIGQLTEIARKKDIPIIITNQVYSDFEVKDRVKMVGGDMMRYASKCIIELENRNLLRRAIVRKHLSVAQDSEAVFRIVERGFEAVDLDFSSE